MTSSRSSRSASARSPRSSRIAPRPRRGSRCPHGLGRRPRTTPFRLMPSAIWLSKCAYDRGRRVALDRALAADCGGRADQHRRRGDLDRTESGLVEEPAAAHACRGRLSTSPSGRGPSNERDSSSPTASGSVAGGGSPIPARRCAPPATPSTRSAACRGARALDASCVPQGSRAGGATRRPATSSPPRNFKSHSLRHEGSRTAR